MADQQKVKFKRTVNGVDEYREVVTPVGVHVEVGETHPIVRYGWGLYSGQAVINCSTGAPAPVTDPSLSKWNPDYKLKGTNTYAPGGDYNIYVTPAAATIAGTGKTVTKIEAYNLPPWLAVNYITYPDGSFGAQATAPVGAGDQIIRLVLTDSTDAKVIQEFIISPVSSTVYVLIRDEPGVGFRLRIGDNSGAIYPRVRIAKFPTGWTDKSIYEMGPFGAIVNSVNYYYAYNDYGPGPAGAYTFEFVHLGQTLYATFIRTGELREEVPTLGTTAPTQDANGISYFSYNAERLRTDRMHTYEVIATGPVRIRTTGPNGYDTGYKNATLIQQQSPIDYLYRLDNYDYLAIGEYPAYVELLNGQATSYIKSYVEIIYNNGYITGPTTLAAGASGNYTLINVTGTRVWSIPATTGVTLNTSTGVLTNNRTTTTSIILTCMVGTNSWTLSISLTGSSSAATYTLGNLYEGVPTAGVPRITRVTRGYKSLGGSNYNLIYWVRGDNLGNGTVYYLQQRHLPATQGAGAVWSSWQTSKIDPTGYDILEGGTTGDFYANLGAAGTATQVEFRIVDSNSTVYSGQTTLHFDYTLPASAQTNTIVYSA